MYWCQIGLDRRWNAFSPLTSRTGPRSSALYVWLAMTSGRRVASRQPPPEPVYNPYCGISGGFLDTIQENAADRNRNAPLRGFALALRPGPAYLPDQGRHGGAELHRHRQQGKIY